MSCMGSRISGRWGSLIGIPFPTRVRASKQFEQAYVLEVFLPGAESLGRDQVSEARHEDLDPWFELDRAAPRPEVVEPGPLDLTRDEYVDLLAIFEHVEALSPCHLWRPARE